ncbi:MAG: mannose-1-phosphate guanylyltransferase [Fimbriimonadaceae bacterium]
MNQRIAVIMAGGSGERFWPVSTKTRPKQFLKLGDPTKTLIEQSVDRASALTSSSQTYIATARHLAETSAKTCPQLPAKNILAEPTKRNTAGALAWVAACLIAEFPETWATTTVAVLTADHRISTQAQFESTAQSAMSAAEDQGAIITIGIRPDRPETGFGYIDCGDSSKDVHKVNKFTEKPDLETAEKFLASGNFLWNSGMFFYTLPTFMSEMERHQPDIARAIRKMAGELAQSQFAEADATFESLPSISIDYALMEKSDKVLVAEAEFIWDDLGAWDSIARSYEPDNLKNVTLGNTNLLESSGNVVYNETSNQTVNILGVDNIAVVVTDDQILIIPKERAQEVKKFLNP